MPDNLSTNLEQRVFTVETPPEICAKYQRLPIVETQIREVLQLSEKDFLMRLAVNNRESEKFLKEETLVCLLSLAHQEYLFQIENLIADRLFLICEKRIRKHLQNQSYDQNFIEETVGDLRLLMLKQFFNRTHESYDFWESRFYKALKLLMFAHLRKHSSNYRATKLFSEFSEEEETELEKKLGQHEVFAKNLETKDINKKFLEQMPEDLRKIFILSYREHETQKTIAATLGITDRTVRNKLDKIKEFLDNWRNSDGEIK